MRHRIGLGVGACVLLFCGLWPAAARAEAIQDRFNTVWESLWFQGGSPQRVIRWPGDIHVRLIGQSVSFHRARVFKALELVAGISGRKVIDVSGASDAETKAQLTVEVVGDRDLEDNMACLVRFDSVQGADIEKATLKMRHQAVYHCVLHEAMHAMGIPGHPSGDTVLSYFYQRVDALTELDGLMLRAWYSSEMKPGMSPLEALVVLTDHVVKASPGDASANRAAQGRFLEETMQSMRAFASDGGDIPVILKRSGKASGDVMRWGRTLMRFYLGLAYLRGTVVVSDAGQSLAWFERAARDGLAGAQMTLGYMHERGVGVAASAAEAYLWYSLAAAQGYEPGKAAADRLAERLTPQQLSDARDRLARFK